MLRSKKIVIYTNFVITWKFMHNIKLIYTTFNSTDDAKPVVEQLIKSKLVACANISSNIQSIYQWEEKIWCNNEVSVILKTTDVALDETVEQLKLLHPYKIPCIIVLPVESCDLEFTKWVGESLI